MNDVIVDPRDKEQKLPENIPSLSWVILSLEIYLTYDSDLYILMRHPYYPTNNTIAHPTGEGYLYPPFFGSVCNFGMYSPQTIGEWKSKTDEYISSIDIGEKIDETVHLYGIGPLHPEYRGSCYEIKASPSSGGHSRLYRIERYICTPRGNFNAFNLTDPSFLKGHVFVPLAGPGDGDEAHLNHPNTFRGKRIVSNFVPVMSDSSELTISKRSAIDVTREHLVKAEKGFVILIDIASFGAACDYIRQNQGNIFEDGDAIGERFRFGVAEIFERLLFRSNAVQSYFTGDGMIIGIPDRLINSKNKSEGVLNLIKRYFECIDTLDGINKRLPDDIVSIGSRIMIHYGNYDYGRVGGPLTMAANFSGDAIVEVARAESGLSSLSKNGEIDGGHLIGVTTSAYEKISGDLEKLDRIGKLSPHQEKIKERTVDFFAGQVSSEDVDD